MASEQQAIVQSKLASGEHLVSMLRAILVQDWVRTFRLLTLVEQQNEYALFVFITSPVPITSLSDLSLERIMPIDGEFKCEIDTGSADSDSVDVYVKITSHKLKLLFELAPGYTTSNFVGDIFRAVEIYTKNRGPPPEFQWVHKYFPSNTGMASTESSENNSCGDSLEAEKGSNSTDSMGFSTGSESGKKAGELESPDIAVSRQNIAMGVTPIAARESVVRYQMAMKEDAYTDAHPFRIFIGTWNVNGQAPTVGLGPWLASDPEPPDIYAVGFQELDLSKEAFLFNDTPREEEWLNAVLNGLHTKAKYRKVKLVRLVGMMLIVFVQEQHAAYVHGVAAETVGTGIMGKMGNKGGVAIRLELHTTSLCFVNSHLAAHVEEYERRNQDYHDICSRLSFSNFIPPKGIKDHDQVYWLGDLNYRITQVEAQEAKRLLIQSNLLPLLEADQLAQQKEAKRVFVGYIEGPITFRPTYKYDPGTDDWDSSEKNRAPAWCDRIMWKGEAVQQLAYRSHMDLKLSDHKPVSAVFVSGIKVIDTVRYRKIYEEVMKKLDKLENEFLPQVMVDNTEIIFGTLRFIEPQSRCLTIANTGQVPVRFEFIKKLNESSYCKEWLSIEPYLGFIMPGEKCDVELEVYVDKKTAWRLNAGQDKLYDILVLHLEGGKDLFITVTGTYKRSCFGCSMQALVNIPQPIMEIPAGRLVDLESKPPKESVLAAEPYPIPKEIWLLVDNIYKCGMNQKHLFEQPGLHSEIVQIRDWLDSGSLKKIPGGVHSVAEALLLLLESSWEPVIPYHLHIRCLDVASNYMQCRQIISQLPEHNRNVFLYLCAFLREILTHSNQNGLDAKTIATLFGSIFLRDPPRSRLDTGAKVKSSQQALDRKKATFVYHFLVNDPQE